MGESKGKGEEDEQEIDSIDKGDDEDDDDDDSTEASNNDSESTSSADMQSSETVRNELLFSNGGPFIKHWNNFIILLAMYNSMTIPLQIFYKDQGHSALLTYPVTLIDAIVDLLFLTDIVITFRTTFLDPK